VDESGLLLLGEAHGVRENPLIARALMQAFGLHGLALEWHEDLASVAAAGPLRLSLFDGTIEAGWSWSQRDEAMARRILAAPAAGAGTLVVAGNAHTPITGTRLGLPLGACIARQRPGVREIRISYGAGRCYNIQPRRFRSRIGPGGRHLRVHQQDDTLILDLPAAGEAVLPPAGG
jgi:hypothetical protein